MLPASVAPLSLVGSPMTVYVVTEFGCNSGCNDMWIPESKVFADRDQAYEYYRKHVPDLKDMDNLARQTDLEDGEAIHELGGYGDGYGDRAKRPRGVVIRCLPVLRSGSSTRGSDPSISGSDPSISGSDPSISGSDPMTSESDPMTSGSDPSTSG